MTTPLTTYLLESKADWPDPATEPDPDAAPDLSADEGGLEWAGDLYEEGDETDPAAAFATFSAGDGLQGWLDRADDGTLTGWVRDTDGAVYRYSDVDAWAIDVRDAAMERTDPVDAGEDLGDEDPEADPEADPDAEGEEDPAADELTDETDPAADDPDPEADPEADPAADDEDPDPAAEADPDADGDDDTDPAADPDAEEDPDDESFYDKMKRKGQGKSFVLTYTPWAGE